MTTLHPTPPNPWALFAFTVLLIIALLAGCDGPVQPETYQVPADTVKSCEPDRKITEEDWGFE